MIRRGAQNRVHRFLLFEHLAEIFVFGAAVIGSLLRIMLFNLRFDHLAASRAAVIKAAVISLLPGIAHGDDLRLSFVKERAHIRLALSAGADDRDILLLARRYELRAAQ